jgi:hypothetical protein
MLLVAICACPGCVPDSALTRGLWSCPGGALVRRRRVGTRVGDGRRRDPRTCASPCARASSIRVGMILSNLIDILDAPAETRRQIGGSALMRSDTHPWRGRIGRRAGADHTGTAGAHRCAIAALRVLVLVAPPSWVSRSARRHLQLTALGAITFAYAR